MGRVTVPDYMKEQKLCSNTTRQSIKLRLITEDVANPRRSDISLWCGWCLGGRRERLKPPERLDVTGDT